MGSGQITCQIYWISCTIFELTGCTGNNFFPVHYNPSTACRRADHANKRSQCTVSRLPVGRTFSELPIAAECSAVEGENTMFPKLPV